MPQSNQVKKKIFKKREIKDYYGEIHKTFLKNEFWFIALFYLFIYF